MLSTKLQLRLNAQPVVTDSREVVFSELLLRVFKNQILQNTGDVVQHFEKSGKIAELDMFNLTYICNYLENCKKEGIETGNYSINLSGLTVSEKSTEILKLSENVLDKLIIEITETTKANVNTAWRLSKIYQEYGGIVALDDFTVDDYSLTLLNHTLPRIVKFDMPQSPKDMDNFIVMARKVLQAVPHAKLVFERINSQNDIDLLNKEVVSNGNYFQSFYTGRDQPRFVTK